MNSTSEHFHADVLFVIPSINGAALLERMLPTVDLPANRIIVLDQDSQDNTEDLCKISGVQFKQLGCPHTYAECCNIAVRLAKAAGCKFVYISNNDITFATAVASELYHEIVRDPSLGILAPSQVIMGAAGDAGILSKRVYWDLSKVNFEHDINIPSDRIHRLESDFCELTCAIVRVEAAELIGGFDDEFKFYHEDADFGFRIRSAGYSCAYLPQSQIIHFANSTFNSGRQDSRLKFIRNSRKRFARKHLGYGFNYIDHGSQSPTSWNIVNQYLYKYMDRMGLIDLDRPELLFAHPGIKPFDHLFTVWETGRLPKEWLQYQGRYKSIYVPSNWNRDVFIEGGFENVKYVPLGVETDTYHPWGMVNREYDQKTFLWFSRDQYRKGLDVMLAVWSEFHNLYPAAKLVVMGHGILSRLSINPHDVLRTDKFYIHEASADGIVYKEIRAALAPEEVAAIYRGVDALVLTSRSEGFGFSVAEALACGTQVVFPSYGASSDMKFSESLTFDGDIISADYSDKNYYDVGNWWEPRPAEIVSAMTIVMEQGEQERSARAQAGVDLMRSKFTWRNAVFSIYNEVSKSQDQSRVNYRYPGGVFSESESYVVSQCLKMQAGSPAVFEASSVDYKNLDYIFSDFDREYYATKNVDVKSGRTNPLSHYVLYGWLENRRPSARFDNMTYLTVSSGARKFLLSLHDELDADSTERAVALFHAWRLHELRKLSTSEVFETADFVEEAVRTLLDGPADSYWKSAFNGLDGINAIRREKFIDLIVSSSHYASSVSRLPRYPGRGEEAFV